MQPEQLTVQLTSQQHAYLIAADWYPESLPALIEAEDRARGAGSKISVTLSREEADRLQSALTRRLAEVGFDPEYELTNEGTIIEDLINALAG